MTCHTLIKSPAPPAGDCAGVSLSSRITSPAVEPSGSGRGSFPDQDSIHNPRKHVCPSCDGGHVAHPRYCFFCGYPMLDTKQAAKAIIQEAHNG